VIEGKLMISINSDKAQRTPMLQRAILHHPSQFKAILKATEIYQYEKESSRHQDSNYVFRMLVDLVGFVTICLETATFCELQLQIPNLLRVADPTTIIFNNPIPSSLHILVAYL
jgi:hypothetical protein